MIAGHDYDEVLHLRNQRSLTRSKVHGPKPGRDGGALGDTILLAPACGTAGGL